MFSVRYIINNNYSNIFVESIKMIHDAGKSNDELGHHLLPLEMFRFLDGEQYNPDYYQVKTYEGKSI